MKKLLDYRKLLSIKELWDRGRPPVAQVLEYQRLMLVVLIPLVVTTAEKQRTGNLPGESV